MRYKSTYQPGKSGQEASRISIAFIKEVAF